MNNAGYTDKTSKTNDCFTTKSNVITERDLYCNVCNILMNRSYLQKGNSKSYSILYICSECTFSFIDEPNERA